jgi:hypothetical protein
MASMPSRRRPKAPPPRPPSDIERFAQSVRESEEAARQAKQAQRDRKTEAELRKTEAELRKIEAVERAARLKRVQAEHVRAVESVREATRTGRGAAAADLAWREAKADLIEMETGRRPAWAGRPDAPTEPTESTGSPEPDTADES